MSEGRFVVIEDGVAQLRLSKGGGESELVDVEPNIKAAGAWMHGSAPGGAGAALQGAVLSAGD